MSTDLARPYVLTAETQATIIELLAQGNYVTTACARAGITRFCFYHWRRRWEAGDPDAQKYDDFFNACEKASAQAEASALVEVRAGAPGWQGNGWFLERRFPKRWGKQDRSPVPPPDKPLKDMTDEELERYGKRVEGKG
jgi:transposase